MTRDPAIVTIDTTDHADAIAALRAWVEYESRGPQPLPPMYANLLTALGAPPVLHAPAPAPTSAPTPEPAIIHPGVTQLDALPGDDPDSEHSHADAILLSAVPTEVADAYERLQDRCAWWKTS